MTSTNLIYGFGQMFYEASSKKKSIKVEQNKDPEENQIVEGYEGECEQCENDKPQKACSICEN